MNGLKYFEFHSLALGKETVDWAPEAEFRLEPNLGDVAWGEGVVQRFHRQAIEAPARARAARAAIVPGRVVR